jgi:hypothetical protein
MELQHLNVRLHLPDHAQPWHDLLIQVDKFRFGEMVDVDFHSRNRVGLSSNTRRATTAGKDPR